MLEQTGRTALEASRANTWVLPPKPAKPFQLARYTGGEHAAVDGEAMRKEAEKTGHRKIAPRSAAASRKNPYIPKETRADRYKAVTAAINDLDGKASTQEIHFLIYHHGKISLAACLRTLQAMEGMGKVRQIDKFAKPAFWELTAASAVEV